MKILYCRYCRKDVPMLDEAEFARVSHVYAKCIQAVKAYRRQYDVALSATPLVELYQPVREMIQDVTGSTEFDVEEVIRRHRISRWE